MDKNYFLGAGIPPALHFDSSTMTTWQSLSLAPEFNCSPEQNSNSSINHNWNKSTDNYTPFESALSSMVSSPAASNSARSGDNFAIRELIGKLGSICNSGEISPESHPLLAATVAGGSKSAHSSCYTTPLNSPPKSHPPITDHQFVKQSFNNFRNSVPVHPNFPAIPADPGFVERAAKFSSFGSRSFNGRSSQLGLNNNNELPRRSTPLAGGTKLPRVSSSPSLKASSGSPPINNQGINNSTKFQTEINGSFPVLDKKSNQSTASAATDRTEFGNSNEGSSLSQQIPSNNESALKSPIDINSRKRKANSRGKSKVAEAEDESNPKRSKSREKENAEVKTEEEAKGKGSSDEEDNGGQEQAKAEPTPPEPPKDYIHVRARRGQATDSHSLAERVRREKIGERMKLLQDLVPGCNKVTGKALMLDEIINYVQSLQHQVEFLSMKLASVNPEQDFSTDSHHKKEGYQPNCCLPQPIYPFGSSGSAFYGQQPEQIPQVQNNVSNGGLTKSLVDPLDTSLCRNIGIQLPSSFDEFNQNLPQFPSFCEDDLHSIVQMGFGPNTDFFSQSFPSN